MSETRGTWMFLFMKKPGEVVLSTGLNLANTEIGSRAQHRSDKSEKSQDRAGRKENLHL